LSIQKFETGVGVHKKVHQKKVTNCCLFFFFQIWKYSMPKSRNPDYIDWRKSTAREYLLEDLSLGGILFQKNEITAAEAWEFYQDQEGFEDVVFPQFRDRLRDHRKNVNENYLRSQREEAALSHDRQLFPRSKTNHRGELVFDLHPAKKVLRQDIKEGRHEGLTPTQFQYQEDRAVYHVFDKTIFKHRMYQEIRRQKYIHYLDLKRVGSRGRAQVQNPWI
jgi:hypothetical protein